MSTEIIQNYYMKNQIKILTDLIAFKTISGQDNSSLIDYCENILKDTWNSILLEVYDDDKKRVNLFGTLKAKNQSTKKPIIYLDTQMWSQCLKVGVSDPFTATIKRDKLIWKRICDMKGFIACTLSLCTNFKESQI